MTAVSRPGWTSTSGRRPSPPSGIRSLSRLRVPIAVQGVRTPPILILASTSSSQVSGAAPKPEACSHTQESACSDPQLWPMVPRHPDTLTGVIIDLKRAGEQAIRDTRLKLGARQRRPVQRQRPQRPQRRLTAADTELPARCPLPHAGLPPELPRPRDRVRRQGAEDLLHHDRPLAQIAIDHGAPQGGRLRPLARTMRGVTYPQCPGRREVAGADEP